MLYQVVDNRTLAIVGEFKSFKRAISRRDQLDNFYGNYRHSVNALDTSWVDAANVALAEGRLFYWSRSRHPTRMNTQLFGSTS
jgi:hypothetical protein